MPTDSQLHGMYVREVRVYMSKTESINSKVEWKAVNWRKVEFAVFKLQKRIYKASQRGEVKLVRRLQKMMVKSWYARLLAVRRVTQENKGKNTAGVDGIKSLSPEQRLKLSENLKLDGKANPTRRVWIPKPGKKEMRPLGIPTMRDRAKQGLLKLALEPEWEAIFEPNSYGFRPGRSCHDAIEAIRLAIRSKPKYVLDADIAKCFDQINHSKLIEKLNTCPSFKRQIRAWLKSGVIDFSQWSERKGYNETSEGTPQGGVFSPLLANIALHGMEQHIAQAYPADKTGKIRCYKRLFGYPVGRPILVRYADDFVILCEELSVVQRCQQLISEWLTDIGLELKPSKTRLAHTLVEHEKEQPGFNFLGFTIRQFPKGKHHCGKSSGNRHGKGKLLGFKTIIKPSAEKIQTHYQSIADWVTTFNGKSQVELIGKLNPIIRGWCNYQSPWNSKEAFSKLDHLIWNKLWSWGKRRHPNKGNKWVARKYWRTIGTQNWVFTTPHKGKNPLKLLKHEEFPAGNQWIKVEGSRSPYDGDSNYWSTRMGDKYLTLDPQKSRLMKIQKGRCALCGQHFKPGDVLEKHHKIQRKEGGNNAEKNLELLHLHCHDQIHGCSNINHAPGCHKQRWQPCTEEPDEVKISRPVLKPSQGGDSLA